MNNTRKALVVGINDYRNFSSLRYAESDAEAIAERLTVHGDDSDDDNFAVMPMLHSTAPVNRITLRARFTICS